MRPAWLLCVAARACECGALVVGDADAAGDADASGDAGVDDAALDAGADAQDEGDGGAHHADAGGADGACATHTDCSGGGSVNWCSAPDAGAEGSAWSCIAGACVWDCGGGRDCALSADGGCVTCAPPGAESCRRTGCTAGVTGFIEVEQSTCPGFPETGARVTVETATDCGSTAHRSAGAEQLGDWFALQDGTLFGNMPGLGGPCVAHELPTGAVRTVWSCPLCQFVLRP
jgi:hypothetical protein